METPRLEDPSSSTWSEGPASDAYPGRRLLAGILRYDHKLASYKIALVRALNDVVLAYPDVLQGSQPVAVPLRMLAEFWLAYYWPFADERGPVYQAPRTHRDDALRQDIAFRGAIANLRRLWARTVISVRPSDGFFLLSEMRVAPLRLHRSLPPDVVEAFHATVAQIAAVIGKNPVRYAGEGEWQVFPRPAPYRALGALSCIPGTNPDDICIVVSATLWQVFTELSLWVEALCIHQWCLFLENVRQGDKPGADRGEVYKLLTDHPENRLPLVWEKNAVNVLMDEGIRFICPWTGRALTRSDAYDLDHIVPIAVYPLNEMWNLVPADSRYNRQIKRDRLPTDALLRRAQPALVETYRFYAGSTMIAPAIRGDAQTRFARLDPSRPDFPSELAASVSTFVARIRDARAVPMFGSAA